MQDNKQPARPAAANGSLMPDIVKEIPVAFPVSQQKPVSEDDELDRIMHDVGQDIQQIGKKKPGHHWFGRQKKVKAEPKFSARPAEQAKAAATPSPLPAKPLPTPAPLKGTPQSSAAIKSKPSQAPVGAVVLAMIVTVGLIAAAYYAYK